MSCGPNCDGCEKCVFADWRYRVRNGDRYAYFEHSTDGLIDAIHYVRNCMDAECVEFRGDDGRWKVSWEDGEVVSNRPGFFVLKPYRSKS
jgi:hypothetical protein